MVTGKPVLMNVTWNLYWIRFAFGCWKKCL